MIFLDEGGSFCYEGQERRRETRGRATYVTPDVTATGRAAWSPPKLEEAGRTLPWRLQREPGSGTA